MMSKNDVKELEDWDLTEKQYNELKAINEKKMPSNQDLARRREILTDFKRFQREDLSYMDFDELVMKIKLKDRYPDRPYLKLERVIEMTWEEYYLLVFDKGKVLLPCHVVKDLTIDEMIPDLSEIIKEHQKRQEALRVDDGSK